ncbi:hypothetical protein BC834DRAFT_1019874 [Gloeopeniophorella convolvens]|nr:hypothetical protein BC834DRAFT_1019874 [Gloeopeniophorella convolvens]
MMPRRAHTHPSARPKASSTPPALTIKTDLPMRLSQLSSSSSNSSSSGSSHTVVPPQIQHRWSELVPPHTALTFVALYDPAEGLLTFSGASLLPPETPATSPDTPDTPTARRRRPFSAPRTPAPSTLADMQSLLDAYFRAGGPACSGGPARASSTFDGLAPCGAAADTASVGCAREKPLPPRPPPPPDRDSVFAWSWLGRMAPEDPRAPWSMDMLPQDADADASSEHACACWAAPRADDSACCASDADDDSFYYTPPELEDPNECSAFSVTTTSTSEYIDVPTRESVWSGSVLAYAYAPQDPPHTPPPPASPTSPAQALLHPWRLLRARTSQSTLAGSPQRRSSKAASMFAKLGRLGTGSRDDGEAWVCVEVVHTVTQRPLRDYEW